MQTQENYLEGLFYRMDSLARDMNYFMKSLYDIYSRGHDRGSGNRFPYRASIEDEMLAIAIANIEHTMDNYDSRYPSRRTGRTDFDISAVAMLLTAYKRMEIQLQAHVECAYNSTEHEKAEHLIAKTAQSARMQRERDEKLRAAKQMQRYKAGPFSIMPIFE